jgi:L-2-hydroxyglutarate oxidase LhgO
MKARMCVQGRRMLYDYCASRGVPHQRIGKLIVATGESQLKEMEALQEKASANGVEDLARLTREKAISMEPQLQCAGALLSPSTGIIDSHALMLAYLGDAENAGAKLVLRSSMEKAFLREGGMELQVNAMSVTAKILINAAGLKAPSVARSIAGYPAKLAPREFYAKGNYFTLSGRAPFSRLVYPVPEPGGLGVHVTLDLAGRARFGPDVEWVDAIDYGVDARRGERFYAAIRRYWPGLPDGALAPGYCGIRPKIAGPGEPAPDFVVQGPREHGVPGLVNLFGIESPGLTASLALAEYVAGSIQE